MSDNRQLAELVGLKFTVECKWTLDDLAKWVYPVLKERGLWDDFRNEWNTKWLRVDLNWGDPTATEEAKEEAISLSINPSASLFAFLIDT